MVNVVIFGHGKQGKLLEKCFDGNNVIIKGFIDNNENDVNCYPVKKIIELEYDYVFISSHKYNDQMRAQLDELNVPSEKIISICKMNDVIEVLYDLFTEKGIACLNYMQSFDEFYSLKEYIELNRKNNMSNLSSLRNHLTALDKYIHKRNTNLYLKEYAEREAAELINEKIIKVEGLGKQVVFDDRFQYFDYILKKVDGRKGLYLEFGVFEGQSINYFSSRIGNNKIYGFDSFEGLPEVWMPDYREGKFSLNGCIPEVNDNVELIKGWFNETLPGFLEEHKDEKCAFINVDCDLYESTRYVLQELKNYLEVGTIICFDEFVGQIGWQQDEYKAWTEFAESENIQYRYLACADVGSWFIAARVAIEITKMDSR